MKIAARFPHTYICVPLCLVFVLVSLTHRALATSDGVQSHPEKKRVAQVVRWQRGDSPEAMAQNLEQRIKVLHEKLSITRKQESKWNTVAQTMRENEAVLSALIHTRRKNAIHMTAPENLRSYEAIAQAHVDGIKRTMAAFQTLYAFMSEEQKMAVDNTFGRFQGSEGHSSDKITEYISP